MALTPGPPGGDEFETAINTTPLVDVMLVLLIVFMITIPVAVHTVPVTLPQASSHARDVQPDTVTIAVTRDSTLYWNGHPVSGPDALDALLRAAAAQPQPPQIDLRGDGSAPYSAIGTVVAAAQRAGLTSLAFVTQPVASAP